MANPYFLTWQEILDQLISFLPPAWRVVTGKVITRLLVAIALTVEALYALLARLLRLSILSTSEGEWLRAIVAGFGMSSFGGVPASVTVRFSRFAPREETIQIPAGAKVGSTYGQQFQTLVGAQLLGGQTEIDVPCRAVKSGVAGNIPAGEIITLITPIAGIDRVNNPNPGSGGTDGETDAQIKARVPPYLESLHRATIPATEYAIAIDKSRFPEVKGFITQRNYGVPGYFRGIISEESGGDLFRARDWRSLGNGIYFVSTGLTQINGLVSAGWPCKRFGVLERSPSGEEAWRASAFVNELEQGSWRFCHDRTAGRLYAKADGRDLNTLQCTVVAGVVQRALRELELRWAANGVFLDVLVPFLVEGAVGLSYILEPGYQQTAVETALRAAVRDYVAALGLGQGFELEGLYARLNRVNGAAGVLITSPAGNVPVPADSVFRVAGAVAIARLSS